MLDCTFYSWIITWFVHGGHGFNLETALRVIDWVFVEQPQNTVFIKCSLAALTILRDQLVSSAFDTLRSTIENANFSAEQLIQVAHQQFSWLSTSPRLFELRSYYKRSRQEAALHNAIFEIMGSKEQLSIAAPMLLASDFFLDEAELAEPERQGKSGTNISDRRHAIPGLQVLSSRRSDSLRDMFDSSNNVPTTRKTFAPLEVLETVEHTLNKTTPRHSPRLDESLPSTTSPSTSERVSTSLDSHISTVAYMFNRQSSLLDLDINSVLTRRENFTRRLTSSQLLASVSQQILPQSFDNFNVLPPPPPPPSSSSSEGFPDFDEDFPSLFEPDHDQDSFTSDRELSTDSETDSNL